MSKIKTLRPLKAVRAHCLDCAGGRPKHVLWCPNDGVHSTRCELWPYRLGVRPETIRQEHGPALVIPELMPPANVNLDALPGNMTAAAEYLAGQDGKSKSKAG